MHHFHVLFRYFLKPKASLSSNSFRVFCFSNLISISLTSFYICKQHYPFCSATIILNVLKKLDIKSLTTFRTRISVELKLSSISSVPFRLQYTIARMFVLYLNNKLTSCSLLSLRLLLLRCLIIELIIASCQIQGRYDETSSDEGGTVIFSESP